MNNYIINPSIFYWMNVCNSVKILSIILTVFGIVSLTIAAGYYFINYYEFYDDEDEDEDWIRFKKLVKTLVIITIVFTLLSIFIPSKETLIQMQVAKLATGENVEIVLQKITDVTKAIIESMK